MNVHYPQRDIRQRELIPPQKLANIHAIVIGVGAVGRQVAMQLSATGVPAMTLIDHDHVAVENLAPQGYWPQDLDVPKVHATGRLCRCIHPQTELTCDAERFRRSSARHLESLRETGCQLAMFCCVDSIVSLRRKTRFSPIFSVFLVKISWKIGMYFSLARSRCGDSCQNAPDLQGEM
jgi:tRNA A37 threonylcarbamoyladenosine dehydratase